MTFAALTGLPAWMPALSFGVHLAAGFAAGTLYFHALLWSTRRFAESGRAMAAVAWTFLRFALLGALLVLTSREGALPLLTTALGIVVARFAVMRRLREVAE